MPNYADGTAFPSNEGAGYLNDIARWSTKYIIPEYNKDWEYGIVDYENGRIINMSKNDSTTPSKTWIRPCMRAMMGSVILCANPGSATGEMLFAYPSTSLSSDKEIETLKCQLRVYMGCAVYQPENLLRLPHVSFEGLMNGHTMNPNDIFQGKDEADGLTKLSDYMNNDGDNTIASVTTRLENECDMDTAEIDKVMGETVYEGAVWRRKRGSTGSAEWTIYTKNTGHLGPLDDPEQCDRLHGMHKCSIAPVSV